MRDRGVDVAMTGSCRVLLISGSLRKGSTNTAVLRTAQAVAPAGVTAVLYTGLSDLPHFNPDDDVEPLHPAVTDLRVQIRSADAVVFSTPEYAGALPGSFKNLLDWTVGDDNVRSIYQKRVSWINASPRGAADAHDSLRRVLGYVKAAVAAEACLHVGVIRTMVGDDGLIADLVIRGQIASALAVLADQTHGDDLGDR